MFVGRLTLLIGLVLGRNPLRANHAQVKSLTISELVRKNTAAERRNSNDNDNDIHKVGQQCRGHTT